MRAWQNNDQSGHQKFLLKFFLVTSERSSPLASCTLHSHLHAPPIIHMHPPAPHHHRPLFSPPFANCICRNHTQHRQCWRNGWLPNGPLWRCCGRRRCVCVVHAWSRPIPPSALRGMLLSTLIDQYVRYARFLLFLNSLRLTSILTLVIGCACARWH
jgi:hypothetical protein